jgi:RNA polymerase sigma-70 factor (ECF subfamily)
VRGVSRALAAIDAMLGDALDGARAPADAIDEAKQVVRTLVLVAKDGKPPGIAGYRGRGSLRGWLRVAATRELVRHVDRDRRAVPLEDALLEDDAVDPALDELKLRYRAELGRAIKSAIDRLPQDDRTLLRHHLLDRLSIDELGARYRIHRATAARRLARAREALVAATQTELAIALRLPEADITSVIRMVSSKIDVSLDDALAESPPRRR